MTGHRGNTRAEPDNACDVQAARELHRCTIPMTPKRYPKLREIFAGVRERAPDARNAFRESASGSDLALKQEVASLLTVR